MPECKIELCTHSHAAKMKQLLCYTGTNPSKSNIEQAEYIPFAEHHTQGCRMHLAGLLLLLSHSSPTCQTPQVSSASHEHAVHLLQLRWTMSSHGHCLGAKIIKEKQKKCALKGNTCNVFWLCDYGRKTKENAMHLYNSLFCYALSFGCATTNVVCLASINLLRLFS